MQYDIVPMRKTNTTTGEDEFSVQLRLNNGDHYTDISLEDAFGHIQMEISAMVSLLYPNTFRNAEDVKFTTKED